MFRLKTNDEIESKLSKFCGSSRFLWNKALSMNLERLEKGQGILWYNELAFWLTLWKRSEEYSFLAECPSQVLQQKLRDLERAFRDCFDKKQPLKRLPVFKRKGRGDNIRFPRGSRLTTEGYFCLKSVGQAFTKARRFPGE